MTINPMCHVRDTLCERRNSSYGGAYDYDTTCRNYLRGRSVMVVRVQSRTYARIKVMTMFVMY